uniref:Uncharacterized protein C18orf8 homolog n=1 Tax=Cacopsylla melanoneura TaxID=428564 RepID=A0A8D8Y5V4_9HEMI
MSVQTGNKMCYLKLCDNPCTFKPTAPTTNVFFDNTNGQIFSVELGDETKISVKGKTDEDSFEFKIKDKGIVKSIKFSPNNQVLGLQRTRNSIEFITMINRMPNNVEIVQHSKGKNNKIYGFEWVNNKEIVFITEQSVEIYDIDVKNMYVKLIKSLSINSHWFVYDYKTKLLLLSTGGNYNNILQPLQLQNCGEINKLSRFEIELFTASSPMSSVATSPVVSPTKLLVLEEDVVLTYVYHLPRILIIRHQQRGSSSTQVIVYTVYKYKTVKRTHTLELADKIDGKFALNIVDNLILVHHKTSKTTMIFDINLSNDSSSNGIISYKLPLMEPKPIRPIEGYETYSSNWVMFEPDIIIDVNKGLLFSIELDISIIMQQFLNNRILFEFLILRNIEKEHVLSLLRRVFIEEANDYMEMIQLIETINFYYEQYLNYQVQINTGKSVKLISLSEYNTVQDSNELSFVKYNYTQRIIIDQTTLYNTVFIQLNERKDKHTLLVCLLMEYIKSLLDHNVAEIEYFIYELLIKTLIFQKQYYQLHQILQYYIVHDSKQIACLLLPLEKLYPPAYQLAVDMLHRLRATDEINHILLYKPNNIITTLRTNTKSDSAVRSLSRKLLQLASNTSDSTSSIEPRQRVDSAASSIAENKHRTIDTARNIVVESGNRSIQDAGNQSSGSTDPKNRVVDTARNRAIDIPRNRSDVLLSERDRVIFYSVFMFYSQYCKQYNFNLMRDQKCFKYIELFETLFDKRL